MQEKDQDITLRQAQAMVDEWIKNVGHGYFSPLTNTAILAEETGEVARAMARIYGDQIAKSTDNLNLADELADLLWVLMAIANQTGIDLTQALIANLAKKTGRDSRRFSSRTD